MTRIDDYLILLEMNSKKSVGKTKLVSMKEAITECVKSGSVLNIEGFTHLICFAAGHEIIRQGIKGLRGVRLTPDLVFDQLIEAGCIDELTFSWAGNPGVGSLHALRRRTEKGCENPIRLNEYSHFGLVARFLAGSSGLPFWPLDNYEGSQIPLHNDMIKSVNCPYTGKKLATVPALHPDITIVHCQRADKEGNAQVWGLMGTQKEAAFAAKKVIVVAEEIVDGSVIRSDPNRTLIPSMIVNFVVHEPWGCHPSYTQGYYDRDNDFYVNWDQISRDPLTYADYLEEFVFKVRDRKEYLRKLGDKLVQKLLAKSMKSEGVNYGF